MPSKFIRKFRIKHDKSWAWHIGIFFCVEPSSIENKKDFYLFLCFGKHDITIGVITEGDSTYAE